MKSASLDQTRIEFRHQVHVIAFSKPRQPKRLVTTQNEIIV